METIPGHAAFRKNDAVDQVLESNLNLIQAAEHIELRDTDSVVAIENMRIIQQGDIQPAATTRAASCRAIFAADITKVLSIGVLELGGERAFANTSGVRFHDTVDSLDALRRNAKAGTYTARCCRAACYERIRPEIQIEKSSVCS